MTKVPLTVHEGGGGSEMGPDGEDPVDPIIEECLKDALAPYLNLLTPEEILEYRRFLTVFITTHPEIAPIYDRLRSRRAVKHSGDVPKGNDTREVPASDVGSGTEGGRR